MRHEEQSSVTEATSSGDQPTSEQGEERAAAPPNADAADDRRGEQAADESPGFRVFDRRHWQLEEEDVEQEQERASAPTYVEQLQRQVEQKDRQLKEYIAAYKKEVVENLEQTKQRLQREADQQARALRAELATPMIDVLEALERSLASAQASPSVEAVVQGLEMVKLLVAQKLRSVGLERIETEGETFDPRVHEAIAVGPVDDPDKHDTVLAEVSPGFILEGRVVRAAKVQVGKLSS